MKCKFIYAIILVCCSIPAIGQEEVKLVQKANLLYKQKQFDLSLPEYRKAVTINPTNYIAQYNLGNVLYRKENWTEAELAYNNAIEHAKSGSAKQKAFYNKGVSFSRQKKLEESIESYKNALKIDARDEDARINLQKALLELKKKRESGENKSPKKPQQKQQPKQQPKENQSKLSKKQVEQLLKALRQKEQQVQQKMQQQKTRSTTNPEKDW